MATLTLWVKALCLPARVLLVEDEPINRTITLSILGNTVQTIDAAEDGEQAVELCHRNDYQLILMDMQMPKMDGLEASRNIRQIAGYGEIPIIAMTANAFTEDRLRCLDAGMNDFLAKPIDPDELRLRVRKWLDR